MMCVNEMDWGEQVMKDVDKNIAYKNMALDGICGAVIYGIAGVLSGKFGLQKRTLLFMYGVYAVAFVVFLLIGKLTGEWGLTGSLESLFKLDEYRKHGIYVGKNLIFT